MQLTRLSLIVQVRGTVFIRISAQPRISAHLERVPILKSEKVNKRPASNKRAPGTLSPSQSNSVSAHPHLTYLSDNEIEIEIE